MTIIDVEKDIVLRDVSDIAPIIDYEKMLAVINNNEFLKKIIVETQINSKEKSTLKHRKIKHIIHSSEFTESMALDVTKTAIDLSLELLNYGIYANDLLAHNFTLENGKWILYDFCSFSYNPDGLKTQIRGTFNISFAAFELMKIIKRNKLKHYFLNRIKYSRLIKMISFPNWLKWYINMKFILMLVSLKQHKQALMLMKKLYEGYNKQYKRTVYNFILKTENKKIYDYIEKLVSENTDVLCLGQFMGDWALYSNTPVSKIFYTDNYTLCDEYYNYLIKNEIKNISTAVFQPLSADEKLNDNIKYRALYDDFTKNRLASSFVLIDFDEVYDTKYKTLSEFCCIISGYAKDCVVIKLRKDKLLAGRIQDEMRKYFEYTDCMDAGIYYILVEKVNISSGKLKNIKYYGNDNRSKDAKKQCNAILDIIKQKV